MKWGSLAPDPSNIDLQQIPLLLHSLEHWSQTLSQILLLAVINTLFTRNLYRKWGPLQSLQICLTLFVLHRQGCPETSGEHFNYSGVCSTTFKPLFLGNVVKGEIGDYVWLIWQSSQCLLYIHITIN